MTYSIYNLTFSALQRAIQTAAISPGPNDPLHLLLERLNLISVQATGDVKPSSSSFPLCAPHHTSLFRAQRWAPLPVSTLLYPSRTKLLMENWTPLQFPALCWLNKPFHLFFILSALLAQAVIPLHRDIELQSFSCRCNWGFSEGGCEALSILSIAQHKIY